MKGIEGAVKLILNQDSYQSNGTGQADLLRESLGILYYPDTFEKSQNYNGSKGKKSQYTTFSQNLEKDIMGKRKSSVLKIGRGIVSKNNHKVSHPNT